MAFKWLDISYANDYYAYNIAYISARVFLKVIPEGIISPVKPVRDNTMVRQKTLESSIRPAASPKCNRRQEAYEKIRKAILSGELFPRERLVALSLAKRFKMSRTPVREALQQLEVQGYVTATPSGGMMVKDYSPEHVQKLYEIRKALECGAIELVCQRITEQQMEKAQRCHEEMSEMNEDARMGNIDKLLELNTTFHIDLLYAAAENKWLLAMIKSIRDQFLERKLARAIIVDNWESKMAQHAQILEAVRKRESSLAHKAVREHLETSLRSILRLL